MSLIIFLIRLSQQDITVIPVRRPSTKEHRRKKQIKLFFINSQKSFKKTPITSKNIKKRFNTEATKI